jgi:hypothetical protein
VVEVLLPDQAFLLGDYLPELLRGLALARFLLLLRRNFLSCWCFLEEHVANIAFHPGASYLFFISLR